LGSAQSPVSGYEASSVLRISEFNFGDSREHLGPSDWHGGEFHAFDSATALFYFFLGHFLIVHTKVIQI